MGHSAFATTRCKHLQLSLITKTSAALNLLAMPSADTVHIALNLFKALGGARGHLTLVIHVRIVAEVFFFSVSLRDAVI